MLVLILRSAHAEDVRQTSNARARVSKDEDEPVHAPSCFETHRSAPEAAPTSVLASAAMLLSTRADALVGILAKRTAFCPNEAKRMRGANTNRRV